jgi:WD40 repeat protein
VAVVLLAGHGGAVLDARFSPDGGRVATASFDGSARLWDTRGEEPRSVVDFDGSRDLPPDLLAIGQGLAFGASWAQPTIPIAFSASHMATVGLTTDAFVLLDAKGQRVGQRPDTEKPPQSIAFGPDGTTFATAGPQGVELWNAADSRRIAQRRIEGSSRVVFSTSGHVLAVASQNHRVYLLDSLSLEPHAELSHDGAVNDVAFGTDDQLVTASDDRTARVWRTHDGKELMRLQHRGLVQTARLSPDGGHIVTASQDGAKIWDAHTPILVGTLDGHAGIVASAAYSDDGVFIVTASFDKSARLWDAKTQRQLMTFLHPTVVIDARFAHDGVHVLTEREDGRVEVWSVPREQHSSTEIEHFVDCMVPIGVVDGLPHPRQPSSCR